MLDLQKTCDADERFAARFPDRFCWLRPASRGEVRQMFGQKVRGWCPCIVVWREGDVYRKAPFLSTSRDVADASDGVAADAAVRAVESLRGDVVLRILMTRSGRSRLEG